MANNGSKIVTRQVENLREAASRARDLAPQVAAAMREELTPLYEPGGPEIDFDLLQVTTGKWISRILDGLSDNQYQRHHLRNLNRHFREQIKNSAAQLRKVLTEIRFGLDVAIGKEATAAYFEGRSSLSRLTAPVLERVATKLLHVFEDPKFGWAEMPERTRTSLENLRRALQEEVGKLQTAFDSLRPERSALMLASGTYQREYLDKKGRLRRAVDLLQGIYRAAGFHLEADNLTPSATQRRRPEPEKSAEPAPLAPQVWSPATATTRAAPAAAPAAAPRLSRKERKRLGQRHRAQPG